jgi:hypothetical protein
VVTERAAIAKGTGALARMGSALGIARGTRRALENMARSDAASGCEGEGRIVARDNKKTGFRGSSENSRC